MVKNLVNKSEFARLAGVSAAAVTKACKGPLLQALDGKRIDADHPIAVEYLTKQDRAQTPPPATGIDPLYEQAVKHCQDSGKWTPSSLRKPLGIGLDRAKILVALMETAGVTKETPKRDMSRTTARPTAPRTISGQESARTTKKSASVVIPQQDEDDGPEMVQARRLPENIATFADWTLQEVIDRYGSDVAFVDYLRALKAIEDVAEKRLKNAQSRGELINRHVVKSGMIDTLDGAFTRMLTDGAKTIATRTHSLVKTGAKVQDIEDLVAKQLSTFITHEVENNEGAA